MDRILILLLALALAGTAHAQDIVVKPFGEACLRYESVEQGGLHGGATRPLVAEPDSIALARAQVRYAHYHADNFATDTDKYWLQLDWTL